MKKKTKKKLSAVEKKFKKNLDALWSKIDDLEDDVRELRGQLYVRRGGGLMSSGEA